MNDSYNKALYYRHLLIVLVILSVNTGNILKSEIRADEKAMQLAESFFRVNAPRFVGGEAKATISLSNVYSSDRQTNTPVFIYQNAGNGFVIVGQNKDCLAILGYSPNGRFNPNDIPPQLSALLSIYEDSVTIFKQQTITKATPAITPLLDQAGVSLNQFGHSEVGNCPTGCVATAFAQIMSYYKYPEKGVGKHCYMEPKYGELCTDFGNTTYNWNNPTDSDYMKLSFHVGISLNMYYCRDQYGSSPSNYRYEEGIHDHFKYFVHNGTSESFYIFNALDNLQPVYATLPGEPGHAVVIDGYDTEGLFHVNFGWGGLYNGYFALNNNKTFDVGYTFGTNIYEALVITPTPSSTNVQDSLALVAVHNGLNGTTGWDLTEPVSTWRGVLVINKRVVRLKLNNSFHTTYKGIIPPEIGQLSALQKLDLLGLFDGDLPSSISQLTELRELKISRGAGTLKINLPADLGNLVNLEILSITNGAEGSIPASIGNLKKLKTLSIIRSSLTGSIPSEIGNLTQLEELSLYNNQLSGSIPATVGNLIRLKDLLLFENQLSGNIPSTIGNLVQLSSLRLNNNKLTGNIPASIGYLVNLNTLLLNNNSLSGNIPDEIGQCILLSNLGLSVNQLEGIIPAGIGNLNGLVNLDLSKNKFTALPNEIGRLTNIKNLYLQQNSFTTLPDSLSKVPQLREIDASYNQLQALPDDFGNWSNIQIILLNNNKLKTFPEQICFAPNLKTIDLASNKIENFPVSIKLISKQIEYFYVDSNLISGKIPSILLENPKLVTLLYHNKFIFEDIPVPNPKFYNSVGKQRPVNFSKKIFKVALGDTVTIDIKSLAPFTSAGNQYYWYSIDRNKNVSDSSNAVLKVPIDEKTIHYKYFCQISNPSSPQYTYVNGTYEMQFACLNSLTTDTISFQLASDEELISEKYDGGIVYSSKNIPQKTINDENVTLVPPWHVRGVIKWQGSIDGITWQDMTENMTQNDLKANLQSIKSNELVLYPKTSAFYRCSVQDINCEPLYSDTIKVNPYGKLIYDDTISVAAGKQLIQSDSVEITIPAGIYDKEFRLTITKSEKIPVISDSLKLLTPYEITCSFAETFDIPLLIKLKNIDKKSFDNKNIHNYKAYYLDEKTHEWVEFENSYVSLLDTTMVIQTNHLTKVAIGWWDKKMGYDQSYVRNNISVFYKSTDEMFLKTTYGKKQTAQSWHEPGIPLMVQDITEYLHEVREVFKANGVTVPENFNVYIKQMDDADGVVGISGMINNYLTIHTFTETPLALRSVLAHEYMHYSQSKYMSPDPGNIFWMEANGHLTDRIVWTEKVIPVSESENYLLNGRKAENSIYNFLSTSWDYWNKGFATQNLLGNLNYCYLAGTFLHYMRSYTQAESKLDPVKLLKETTLWSGDSWRTYLSNYIAFSMKSMIGDEYENFVKFILSGEEPNFTILNTNGNPYSDIIRHSGQENDGMFAKRIVYDFEASALPSQKDHVEVSVPHLASKMFLLHNSTASKAVVVSLKRLDDASGHQNKIYFGKYNFKDKKVEFTDISDSTKYNFLIETRNPKTADQYQSICFLLIINKNNPTGNEEKNFEAEFELNAVPVIDIEYLRSGYIAGENGSNLGVHKDNEGIVTNFVLYSYIDESSANKQSSFELINDSSYAVTVTYRNFDSFEFEKYHHTSEVIGAMYIVYNFYASTLQITNKSTYIARVSTLEKANMLNLVSTNEQILHVKNFVNYQAYPNVAWFRTNNSTETQAAVEKMSQNIRSTYYDWDTGEALTVKHHSIVSTMYERGDIILYLHFLTR